MSSIASIFRPKIIRRVLLLGLLAAPIVYLFGTQIGALAGAHGQELLADYEETQTQSITENYTNNEDITFQNNKFGISKIYGNSYISGENVLTDNQTAMIYSSTSGSYSVELGNINLRGFSQARDTIDYNGLITRNTTYRNLGTLPWSKTSVFYLIPSDLTARNIKLGAPFFSYFNSIENVSGGSLSWNGQYIYFNYSSDSIFANMSVGDFRNYMAGKYALFTANIVTFEETSSLGIMNLNSSSPVTVNIPNSFSFDFTYWGLDYKTKSIYKENLFGYMFGKSNFLTDWGTSVLDDTAVGFEPVNALLQYVGGDMLHLGDTQIGLMALGYSTYLFNVLIVYMLVSLCASLICLPLKVTDIFNRGENL